MNAPSEHPSLDELRKDVRVLGALLGDVLREQGGPLLFERVEDARLAARACRRGELGVDRALDDALGNLTPGESAEVVRAFSAYFGLVNMAERVHRVRRLVRDPGSETDLRRAVGRLREAGVGLAAVRRLLAETQISPVFTAHPTEAVRRTLLVKEQRFARAMLARLDGSVDDAEALRRIREEVTISWQTDEHRASRPAVADEVEHVLFYLSDVVYRVVPELYAHVAAGLRDTYGEGADEELAGRLLRFGSWVGGDMDGNPNVGAETIRTTLARHRELILARYREDVRDLFDRLSQSRSRSEFDVAVMERIDSCRADLPGVIDEIPGRYHGMPYRVLLWLISARLDATAADEDGAYDSPQALCEDLQVIGGSLRRHHGPHAGLDRVEGLIRRVQTFGFHLATLDIRQDADIHRRVAGQLLGDEGFADLAPEARAERLATALGRVGESDAPNTDAPEVRAALDVIGAVRDGRRRYGSESVGPYIVSMARGPDDALAVLWIAAQGGLREADGSIPLDVAPLFETLEDLDRADRALESLLSDEVYRAHLARRGGRQVVMLGYSDSSKGAGLAASRWALFRAQERMVDVAERHGVRLDFFHGRGGTISRGGSKPREAILAEPPGAVAGRFRITEQGEIIHAKYGLQSLALRTLELLTGAVLETAAAPPDSRAPEGPGREIADCVAEASREAYRALVEHPRFVAYFRAATPIDVIERFTIGSRPASRRDGGGVESLRAIPWVFAWMQSRHLLPGWFGLGSGLEAAVERFGVEMLREVASGWPFFGTLLADAEMVLAKADLGIAERYARLAGDDGDELFPVIEAEHERTLRLVCAVQGIDEPLDREPVLQRSIRLRNPYVDPMSLVQVELLPRWRASDRADEELERALVTTVIGIARGLQNTG